MAGPKKKFLNSTWLTHVEKILKLFELKSNYKKKKFFFLKKNKVDMAWT